MLPVAGGVLPRMVIARLESRLWERIPIWNYSRVHEIDQLCCAGRHGAKF